MIKIDLKLAEQSVKEIESLIGICPKIKDDPTEHYENMAYFATLAEISKRQAAAFEAIVEDFKMEIKKWKKVKGQ